MTTDQTEAAGSLTPFSPEAVKLAANQTQHPAAILEAAISRLNDDPSALFQVDIVGAARQLRASDELAYLRLMTRADGCKTRMDKLTAPERDTREPNAHDRVIDVAKSKCLLHHDANGRGVAVTTTGGIRQVWYLDGSGFADWLRAEYFDQYETGISDPVMSTAIGTLSAIAKHKGEEVEVHLRCARHGDAYYIDLCNSRWEAVCVDACGWEVVATPPVLFTRTPNMRPLPTPTPPGNIDALWQHINIREEDRALVLSWALDACRPDTPFPLLELVGEQGSAKSSSQKKLRDLIDPNKVALRGRPKSTEDIFVAAANNWIVSFENLSSLTPEQQDALCTTATGGGFATRQFYTNGDEHVLEAKRPVMINGINAAATRPDLIERTIHIEAPTIPPDERRDQAQLDAAWQEDLPRIFAGTLDLFSDTLRVLRNVVLTQKHRMADFQLLGEAMLQAQGHAAGEFSELYSRKVADGIARALESFGVANAIQVLLNGTPGKTWQGTTQALLSDLNRYMGADSSNWPKLPRGLTHQLNRLAPSLRAIGIEITYLDKRTNKGRELRLSWKNANC